MWIAIVSLVYLFALFWVGFAIGYYLWRWLSQYNWEEKLEKMRAVFFLTVT